MKRRPIYGILAEFRTPTELVHAAHRAYQEGYRDMDGYSPFPIKELTEALGLSERTKVPLLVLLGGITGMIGGYLMQYYISVIAYRLNVGSRPLHSWPAFIPVTFEMTVLFASIAAVLGMFALNGLPQPYHPVFNVPNFVRATRDRFFLCIKSTDPKFDREKTAAFLESLNPVEVSEVAD